MTQDSLKLLEHAIRRLAHSRQDDKAWGELHELLWPRLFAASYRILRGIRALAEDATQECLVRLFRHSRFSDFIAKPDAFLSYALVVCRNISLTYLKKLLKEPESTDEQPDDATEPRADLEDNPELAVVRMDLLAKFTLTLDPPNRDLLAFLLDGHTIAEISVTLGVGYSAIAVRIHRLRNELAKLLKNWEI